MNTIDRDEISEDHSAELIGWVYDNTELEKLFFTPKVFWETILRRLKNADSEIFNGERRILVYRHFDVLAYISAILETDEAKENLFFYVESEDDVVHLFVKDFIPSENIIVGNKLINSEKFKNMPKFDVIVGNPPYQESNDTGGALWLKIINKSIDLLKEDGHLAMIHPPSFVGKHNKEKKGKSDYSNFSKFQMVELHIFDNTTKNEYFNGVGTRICWYILQKSPIKTSTKLFGHYKNKVNEYNINFLTEIFLPRDINDISMSIHKKISAASPLEFIQTRKLHYHTMKRKGTVSDSKTTKHLYKSHFSHQKEKIRYSSFKIDDYDSIKVMVPQASTMGNAFIDKECNVSEDLMYIKCETLEEAEDKLKHLKSNLIKYIGDNYRPGRNLGDILLSGIIPASELNLTHEEIEYIANYVK